MIKLILVLSLLLSREVTSTSDRQVLDSEYLSSDEIKFGHPEASSYEETQDQDSEVFSGGYTEDDDSEVLSGNWTLESDSELLKFFEKQVPGIGEILMKPNWIGKVYDLLIGEALISAGKAYPLKVEPEAYDEYDFIVVGAGSAGSTVAGRLSENKDFKILVLEEGGEESAFSDIPGVNVLLSKSPMVQPYLTVPQKNAARGMKNGGISTWVGRAIGGGSSHNLLIYNRGNKLVFDRWEDVYGAKGWSYKNVLPYYLKAEGVGPEGYSIFDKEYHSKGGPLSVTGKLEPSKVGFAIMDGVKELGLPVGDYNGKDQLTFNFVQTTIRGGERCSTGKAYLGPSSIKHKNLNVVTKALVTKILLDDKNTAYGVEYEKNGKLHKVMAKKEVILSAGTFGTPKLLMLSGIGPKFELEKFNIPVRVDLPGVGKNLQTHAVTYLYYKTRKNSTMVYTRPEPYFEATKQYLKDRTGFLSTSSAEVAGYIRTKYALDERPDVIIYNEGGYPGSMISNILYGYLYGFSKEVIDKYLTPNSYKDAFVFIPGLYQPRSKGEVRLVSRDPRDQLLLDYRTFSDKKDLKSIVEGCKLIDRIMNTKAVQIKLNAEPFENTLPGCTEYDYGTDDYFACVAQTLTGDGWHQCCTARMGTPSDPMAVVDPELKVIGVNKLRVVDLSIMPEIPNSNTNAPANMIGEKAADIIMSKYSK